MSSPAPAQAQAPPPPPSVPAPTTPLSSTPVSVQPRPSQPKPPPRFPQPPKPFSRPTSPHSRPRAPPMSSPAMPPPSARVPSAALPSTPISVQPRPLQPVRPPPPRQPPPPTAPYPQLARICFNRHCKDPKSEGPRRGAWRVRSGDYAGLCDRCYVPFVQGSFCETFHSAVAGWRNCDACGKRLHCGCIVSALVYALLDDGGVYCIVCARKSCAPMAPPPSQIPTPPVNLPHNVAQKKGSSDKSWRPATGQRRQTNLPSGTSQKLPPGVTSIRAKGKKSDDRPTTPAGVNQIMRGGDGPNPSTSLRDPGHHGVGNDSSSSRKGIISDGGSTVTTGAKLDKQHPSVIAHESGSGRPSGSEILPPGAAVIGAKEKKSDDRPTAPAGMNQIIRDRDGPNPNGNLHDPGYHGGQNDSSSSRKGMISDGGSILSTGAKLDKHHPSVLKDDASTRRVGGINITNLPPVDGPQDHINELQTQFGNGSGSPGMVPQPRSQLPPCRGPTTTDPEPQHLPGSYPKQPSNPIITTLFERVLSATDVSRADRLALPKVCAESYFPPISRPEGIPLKIQDEIGEERVFQFRYWPNSNNRIYVLEDTTHYLQSIKLQAGDRVSFGRIESEGTLVMRSERQVVQQRRAECIRKPAGGVPTQRLEVNSKVSARDFSPNAALLQPNDVNNKQSKNFSPMEQAAASKMDKGGLAQKGRPGTACSSPDFSPNTALPQPYKVDNTQGKNSSPVEQAAAFKMDKGELPQKEGPGSAYFSPYSSPNAVIPEPDKVNSTQSKSSSPVKQAAASKMDKCGLTQKEGPGHAHYSPYSGPNVVSTRPNKVNVERKNSSPVEEAAASTMDRGGLAHIRAPGTAGSSPGHVKRKDPSASQKIKRLRVENLESLEVKITCQEAQELLHPPLKAPSIVVVDGHEFEEYAEPPILGRRTCFLTNPSGEHCSKWRKLPADTLLHSKWTCSHNKWDPERNSCASAQETSLEELAGLIPIKAGAEKKAEVGIETDNTEVLGALDTLANLAILGEGESLPSQPTTKHPRHRAGCSCIVCIQPPSGTGSKHMHLCTCNVCMTVRRHFKTLGLRREKRQSEKDWKSPRRKETGQPSEPMDGSEEMAVDHRMVFSPIKNQIGLNI